MVRIDLEAEENPLVEVTFDAGRFAGRTFRSVLQPCLDVTCECGNIYLEFESEDGEDYFECTLSTQEEDVIAYDLGEKGGEDREEKDFVEHLSDELVEENWQQLSAFYLGIKAVATEVIEPEEILANFSVDVAEQGIMFSYSDVLPYALPFTFECEGTPFEAEDLYCLMTNCGCTVINLNFWRLNEEADSEEEKPDLWVDYDYRNGKTDVLQWQKDSPFTAEQLLNTLGEQLPEFNQLVKKRHERLRAVYATSRSGPISIQRRPGRPETWKHLLN